MGLAGSKSTAERGEMAHRANDFRVRAFANAVGIKAGCFRKAIGQGRVGRLGNRAGARNFIHRCSGSGNRRNKRTAPSELNAKRLKITHFPK